MTEAAAPVLDEVEVMTPRATLESIAQQCEIAITERTAKRFSTRDSLKALEKRCRTLLDRPDDRAWHADFEKILATALPVFDQLIAEAEPAGHA